MLIRDAEERDLDEITAIYNDLVEHSTAVFHDQAVTVDDRRQWWQERVGLGLPVLVAIDEEGTLAGYAACGPFRDWPGYRYTAEGTMHIREGRQRQGIGQKLLPELLARTQAAGMHVVTAWVDSENAASLGFLRRYGFADCGTMKEAGFKFGHYRDVTVLQYTFTVTPDDGAERTEVAG